MKLNKWKDVTCKCDETKTLVDMPSTYNRPYIDKLVNALGASKAKIVDAKQASHNVFSVGLHVASEKEMRIDAAYDGKTYFLVYPSQESTSDFEPGFLFRHLQGVNHQKQAFVSSRESLLVQRRVVSVKGSSGHPSLADAKAVEENGVEDKIVYSGDIDLFMPSTGLTLIGSYNEHGNIVANSAALTSSSNELKISLNGSKLIVDHKQDTIEVMPSIDVSQLVFKIQRTGIIVNFERLNFEHNSGKPKCSFESGKLLHAGAGS